MTYSDYSNSELNEEEDVEEEVPIMPPPPSKPIAKTDAAVYSSVCTSSTAKQYGDIYKVPPEYQLCAPAADQRANAPPPGYAAIYTDHFRHGLRLPLPPFVVSVLAHYQIALAQLHPNCIITLLGFVEICRRVSIAPSLTLFRHFFRLGRNSNLKEGWYTFNQNLPRIVQGKSPYVKGWKTSFLFFRTAPIMGNLALSWNYSCVMDLPQSQPEKPSIQTVIRFLSNAVEYQMPLEAQEESMAEAGSASMAFVPRTARAKPATASTERVKRTAKFEASKPAKTRRGATGKWCVDESSQSFKDMTLDQFATYNQNCLRSFYLKLQGEKDELEKIVAEKDTEIASLQEDKEYLEKIVADKDTEISSLEGDKEELEEVVAAMEQYVKDKGNENALLKAEVSQLQGVIDDRGPLLRVYTWKLLKTRGFAKFIYDLATLVKSLGRREAAELVRIRYPGIPEEALVGLEDPLAASKLDNLFFDMVQDDAFDFPLLGYLLSLAEIPSSSQLKCLDVDEDQDALIRQ